MVQKTYGLLWSIFVKAHLYPQFSVIFLFSSNLYAFVSPYTKNHPVIFLKYNRKKWRQIRLHPYKNLLKKFDLNKNCEVINDLTYLFHSTNIEIYPMPIKSLSKIKTIIQMKKLQPLTSKNSGFSVSLSIIDHISVWS